MKLLPLLLFLALNGCVLHDLYRLHQDEPIEDVKPFAQTALSLNPFKKKDEFKALKTFIQAHKADYEVVLVHEKEVVEGGERTPFTYAGYRIWCVKGAA